MSNHFADRLIEAVKTKGNAICVGLDPRMAQIPDIIKKKVIAESENKSPLALAANILLEFNKGIIDVVADLVPVVKPQIAFYEIYGYEGVRAFEETLKYAKSKGLITIADAKRNDIGSTAEAYAQAFLGEVEVEVDGEEVIMPIFDADSITVNAYLGWDGIKPFLEEGSKYGKGFFSLVKTSNPSSGDLQDLAISENNEAVFEIMGRLLDSWGADHIGESGYSSAGAVVGATYPAQAEKLRILMPNTIFLVPGYGAQGGGAVDCKPCFNEDGLGAIVNNSRGIIFAYEKMENFGPENYAEAAREAVIAMKKDLDSIF